MGTTQSVISRLEEGGGRDDRDPAHREEFLSLVNGCGIDVRVTVSYPVTRRGQEAARVLGLRVFSKISIGTAQLSS